MQGRQPSVTSLCQRSPLGTHESAIYSFSAITVTQHWPMLKASALHIFWTQLSAIYLLLVIWQQGSLQSGCYDAIPIYAAAVCDLFWLHQWDRWQQGTPQHMACTSPRGILSHKRETACKNSYPAQRESGRLIDTEDAPSKEWRHATQTWPTDYFPSVCNSQHFTRHC